MNKENNPILSKFQTVCDESNASSDICKLGESIVKMSLIDVALLAKILSETFGVSMVSSVSGSAGASEDTDSSAPAEKTEFKVKVVNVDSMEKVPAIQAIRKVFTDLQLKAASDLLKAGTIFDKVFKVEEADNLIAELGKCKVIAEKV